MKFNLSRYNDLGKCSLGTLKEYWDTDVDKIYVCKDIFDTESGTEIEVKNVEDLFPYLWTSPAISYGSNNGTINIFSPNQKPWFVRQLENSIKNENAQLKRVQKSKSKRKKENIEFILKWLNDTQSLLCDLKQRMFENQKELLEDNKNV